MARQRIKKVRSALRDKGLDALIVSSLHNIRYLTGFTGTNALCIVRDHDAFFLTDSRYGLQSETEVAGFKRNVTARGLFEGAARHGMLRGVAKVGFESHHITYAQYRQLKKLFPSVSLQPTADFIEQIAAVKDAEEVKTIRKAVTISDRVFAEILKNLRAGVRELDIAAEIAYLHRRFGAEKDAFEAIVASGVRGCLPHARASAKKIRRGEMVTLDFGCTVDGYNSDITRTVAVGSISRQKRRMYDLVLDAQREAIAAARGGMAAKDLDAVARKRIRTGGFGRYFIHSLGHGLGLHVHERPRVSSSSKDQLQAGSVITIEPGVYIPDVGGVRIEDDVLLTERGCEVLNRAPKELMIV